MDFNDFVSMPAVNPLLLRGLLGKDAQTFIKKPARLATVLLTSGKLGIFSSESVVAIIDRLTGGGTFSELTPHAQDESVPWYQRREIKVVTSDITARALRVLPDDLPVYGEEAGKFAVAEACRQSMSLPLFFEPVVQPYRQLPPGTESTIMDGGVLSNFPLWIFDADRDPATRRQPRCPTIGFLLVEPHEPPPPPKAVTNILSKVIGTVATLYQQREAQWQRSNPEVVRERTINIPVPEGITTTSFSLSDTDRDRLWTAGYTSAANFIKEFMFSEHLQHRGFPEAAEALNKS